MGPSQGEIKARIAVLEARVSSLSDDIRLLKLDLRHAQDALSNASEWSQPEQKRNVAEIKAAIGNKVDEITLAHSQIMESKRLLVTS